jgi:hypothetical protein
LRRSYASGERQASVDGNDLSGHPIRSRIRELDDPSCNVIRSSAALERYLFAFRLLDHRGMFRREAQAWTDDVHRKDGVDAFGGCVTQQQKCAAPALARDRDIGEEAYDVLVQGGAL